MWSWSIRIFETARAPRIHDVHVGAINVTKRGSSAWASKSSRNGAVEVDRSRIVACGEDDLPQEVAAITNAADTASLTRR